MPPPSQLAIATSSVNRLLREEASYHKELADQEVQVKSLEEKIKNGQGNDEDGNQEFILKQQQTAVEQTKAIFGPLRQRIEDAVAKLEEQIALREEGGAQDSEVEQAKSTLEKAKEYTGSS